MKKKLLIMMLALAFIVVGCSNKNSDTVATVDGVGISQETFDLYYKIQRNNLVAQLGEDVLKEKDTRDTLGRTYGEMIRTNLLDNLIKNQVWLNEANKMKIEGIDAKVDEQITNEKTMAGEEQFKASLESLGISEEQYRNLVKDNITVAEFRTQKMASYEISDEEIQKYYDENKEHLVQAEARHILVKTEEEANNVKKRIENGEDFAELAKELSLDPGSAANGGNLGYFAKGKMVQPFNDFVFSASVGDVSDPVKTEHGFHIIEVTGIKNSLEGFKDDIKEFIQNEKFVEEMKQVEEKAKVKKTIDLSKEPESIRKELEEKKTEAPAENQGETKPAEKPAENKEEAKPAEKPAEESKPEETKKP